MKTKAVKVKERITSVGLLAKSSQLYYDYGVETIEDRAVIGNLDGLKPVMRRALYATFTGGTFSNKPRVKSARIVGDTLGKYHPHGDTSCYDAIVEAANLPMPTIDGYGNWGSMSDGPAAMRYTEARLSKYGELCFFDRFYLPAMQTIPNYDDKEREPLTLPAMLPNAIINGSFGICPGVNTRIPSFTMASVFALLQKVLAAGGTCTVEQALSLQPIAKYGALANWDKSDKLALRTFFKTGVGSITFVPAKEKTGENQIRYWRFGLMPDDLTKTLARLTNEAGVVRVNEDCYESDPFNGALLVDLKKGMTKGERIKAGNRVTALLTTAARVDVKVTDRSLTETGGRAAKLRSSCIPQMVTDWIAFRIGLEKSACAYWIGKRKERIEYLKLILIAIKNRAIIIKALDKEGLDDAALDAYLAKLLKITVEQAHVICDMMIRRLKALDTTKTKAEIKALEEEIAGYQQRIKDPVSYIKLHLKRLATELEPMYRRQTLTSCPPRTKKKSKRAKGKKS